MSDPIKEIENKLNELEFNEFYRWIVINMSRLKGEKKPTRKKRVGELTNLHTHPRHSSSKY